MNIEDLTAVSVCGVLNIYSKKGANCKIENRSHYALSFCGSGKIMYVMNGEKTVSDNRHIVILPKGGSYKIFRQETGVFPLIDFECAEKLTDKILGFEINDIRPVYDLFSRLEKSFQKENRFGALAVFYEILSAVFESGGKENVSELSEYILNNLSDSELSNRKIAEHFNISESYLDKLFVKKSGISPKKFVIKKRMELAARLLGENRYNTREISEKCGYGSIFSFSRAFGNYWGVSPLQYKKETNNM